jgi:hypothetical protein
MSLIGRLLLYAVPEVEVPLIDCDFNRSTQRLNSDCRERDVENETKTANLLLRYTEGIHVGSVAERRFYV